MQWWDHEANAPALWATVTVAARREVAWRCPDCAVPFTARVLDMVRRPKCPVCEVERQRAWDALVAKYRQTHVADVPALAAAWADDTDPRFVAVAGDWRLRRFRCPRGHHPRLSPLTYLQSGCPSCRGQATLAERIATSDAHVSPAGMPPEIAAQWHPTKNGDRDVSTVSPGSRKAFWWRDPLCGHEWEETPTRRDQGQRLRCPVCRTILDSLAFHCQRRPKTDPLAAGENGPLSWCGQSVGAAGGRPRSRFLSR
ncbi:zinc-ribbon domain-containing protein [Cellulomonas sp. APG4]|nr:zinc-ribbon domain-containing protein [Cellulomonas sp. APG4]